MKDVKLTIHNRQVIIKTAHTKEVNATLENTPWEELQVLRECIKDTIILTFPNKKMAERTYFHLNRMFKLPKFVLNVLIEKGKKEAEKRKQTLEKVV